MVSELVRCLDHGGGGSTFTIFWKDWKKKKKTQPQCEGSVGSLISTGHSPTKVNIYKGIFLLLQGLLMCGEEGSKILTNY